MASASFPHHFTSCLNFLMTFPMPLRLSPIPFRVGTDICSIPRIQKAITRPNDGDPQKPLRRFLKKLLTEHERQYFWKRFGSGAPFTNVERASQFLAGRYVYAILWSIQFVAAHLTGKGSPQRKPVVKHALIYTTNHGASSGL